MTINPTTNSQNLSSASTNTMIAGYKMGHSHEIDISKSMFQKINTIATAGMGLLILELLADYSLNVWNWSQSSEKEWYPLFGQTLGGPLVLPNVQTETGKAIIFATAGMALGIVRGMTADYIKLNDQRKANYDVNPGAVTQ